MQSSRRDVMGGPSGLSLVALDTSSDIPARRAYFCEIYLYRVVYLTCCILAYLLISMMLSCCLCILRVLVGNYNVGDCASETKYASDRACGLKLWVYGVLRISTLA